jgi:hypothetical protein
MFNFNNNLYNKIKTNSNNNLIHNNNNLTHNSNNNNHSNNNNLNKIACKTKCNNFYLIESLY